MNSNSRQSIRLAISPVLFLSAVASAQPAADAAPAPPAPVSATAEPAQPKPASGDVVATPAAPSAPAAPSLLHADGTLQSASPPAAVAAVETPSTNPVGSKWSMKIYGFVEVDAVHDSTQAYPDLGGWGTTAIPMSYSYAGSHGRTQFTARNSRFGFLVGTPDFNGVRATGTLEGDFMGNQPSDASESAVITNGAFRLRVASILLQSD